MVTPRHLETGSEVQEVASVSQTWRLSGEGAGSTMEGVLLPQRTEALRKEGGPWLWGSHRDPTAQGRVGGGLGTLRFQNHPLTSL